MAASGYTAWSVTVGEQPTTAYWNLLGSNDASFNTGAGFNDQIITWRHLDPSLFPSGLIQMWGGTSAPTNWLLCDGTAYSRSTYAALFAIIGVSYGSGDGSTTFNVPNLQGKVPTGVDGTAEFPSLGATGGSKDIMAHSHTGGTDTQGNHNHGSTTNFFQDAGGAGNLSTGSLGNNFMRGNVNVTTTTNGAHSHNVSTNTTGSGANNLTPYLVVNFIIKT